MILWFLGVCLYSVAGTFTSALIAYGTRKHDDRGEAGFMIVAGGLVWPLLGVFYLLAGMVHLFYRQMMVAGRIIGHRRHAQNIMVATTRLMEDDLSRVSGNELALSFEYKPCPTCFGSGCNRCDDGAVRVKNGVVVNAGGHRRNY